MLFGQLTEFKRDTLGLLVDMQRRFGGVVRLKMGPYLVHQLSSPAAIAEVLTRQHRHFRRGRFYRGFRLFFGRGSLTTDGDEWRLLRKRTQPFFHRERLRADAALITGAAAELLAEWEHAAGTGARVDVTKGSLRLAIAVIGDMFFDYDLRPHVPELAPVTEFAVGAMIMNGSISQMLPDWVPTPYRRKLRRHQATLDRVFDTVIARQRSRLGRGGRADTLIAALLTGQDGETLTEEQIRAELKTVFLAGHETTACALTWTLIEVYKSAEVERRLLAEVTGELGDRTPAPQDLERMPYLTAVVSESLRLHPPIWSFPRDTMVPVRIDGYDIPAGSTVLVCPYAAHRDPRAWGDPDHFDPDRFLSPPQTLPRMQYIPFGAGPRKCIGMDLALLEVSLAVAMIVRRVHLAIDADTVFREVPVVSLRATPEVVVPVESRDVL